MIGKWEKRIAKIGSFLVKREESIEPVYTSSKDHKNSFINDDQNVFITSQE